MLICLQLMSAWLDAALGHALRAAAPVALQTSDIMFLKEINASGRGSGNKAGPTLALWPLQEDASFDDLHAAPGEAYLMAQSLSADQVR